LRSFLTAKYENQLDVYINFNGQICKKIYSTTTTTTAAAQESDDEDFGIKKFLSDLKDLKDLPKFNPLNLSYALSLILCENNSRKLSSPSKSSVLIINENVSVPSSQYVQLMNSLFEAQRNGIKINVLDLMNQDTSNVLLKQSASITSGWYINLKSISEVIPTLLNFPAELSSSAQSILNCPKQEVIDFRGSCYCHGKVVDLGYVCSVCLSGNIIIYNLFNILFHFIDLF
jgi:transcription initiation factor TFIIH subunit 3